jgi:RluA family pseudouridine synthase
VAKPNFIELGFGKNIDRIPIVYEDRSILAIDKPAGWMLVPFSWQQTNRNLQAAITSSIAAGDFWARSRNLKFLRFVHRLDADTTGILLAAKSQGAVESFGDMFESRRMEKIYYAVAKGVPKEPEWTCRLKIASDPEEIGRMVVDEGEEAKESETFFKVLGTREQSGEKWSLIEAHPITGRTHQIRIHLKESGLPIVGDPLYRADVTKSSFHPNRDYPLGLRAGELSYVDPFQRRRIHIKAQNEKFLRAFGF